MATHIPSLEMLPLPPTLLLQPSLLLPLSEDLCDDIELTQISQNNLLRILNLITSQSPFCHIKGCLQAWGLRCSSITES